VACVGAGAAAASLVGEDVGWVQAFPNGELGRADSGGAVGGHTRTARGACPGPKKRRRDGEGEARPRRRRRRRGLGGGGRRTGLGLEAGEGNARRSGRGAGRGWGGRGGEGGEKGRMKRSRGSGCPNWRSGETSESQKPLVLGLLVIGQAVVILPPLTS